MNHSQFKLVAICSLVAVLLVLSGCVEENGSLYDPNADPGPQPALTSIVSTLLPDSALAEYDTLTITGTNFAPTAQDNWVYFNEGVRSPYAATQTELQVVAPRQIGSDIAIRVARRSSDLLSDPFTYKIGAAVEQFGGVVDTSAHAMATDAAGNLYVALSALSATGSRGDAGIYVVSPDGARWRYTPPTAGLVNWTGLRMGPGGFLYAARNQRAIYRISPGGGAAAAWMQITSPAGVLLTEIEFDQSGNLWAGGNNPNIYCIRPDRTVRANPFASTVRSLRVFNGSLYISALIGGENKIWRAPILGDSLGTAEVYYDFQAAYGSLGYIPYAITFSSDGDMFIGTKSPEGILVVRPGGSVIAPYSPYTELFSPTMKYLSWGPGKSLYGSSDLVVTPASEGLLLRVQTRQTGAPYYGQ